MMSMMMMMMMEMMMATVYRGRNINDVSSLLKMWSPLRVNHSGTIIASFLLLIARGQGGTGFGGAGYVQEAEPG